MVLFFVTERRGVGQPTKIMSHLVPFMAPVEGLAAAAPATAEHAVGPVVAVPRRVYLRRR